MKMVRRVAGTVLVLCLLGALAGCDFLVAPAPFGAPSDSLDDGDANSPAAPDEPTTDADAHVDADADADADDDTEGNDDADEAVNAEPGLTISPTTMSVPEG
ncbi:MAG: hypothetical protein ACOCU4_02070, partial [Alkalispirochaeta sp.]